MRYLELPPPPSLAAFVHCLWVLEDTTADGEPESVVPDGHPEVVLHAREPFHVRGADGALTRQAPALFAGQLRSAFELVPRGPRCMVGARLHPFAGGAFLADAARGVADRVVPLDDLPGRAGRDAAERVATAATDGGRLAALVSLLEARLLERPRPDVVAAACARIRASGGREPVAAVARAVGTGLRSLERRFADEVGLTPKELARIERFQAALRLAEDGRASWADVAAATGYADQAHLTREFRRLTGLPPARFAATPHELAGHIAGVGFVQDPGEAAGHPGASPTETDPR